jgi:hypothetical protein
MGIAFHIEDDENRRRQAGCGERRMMAPEVLFEDSWGLEADIWTLGATVTHLSHII